MYRAGGWSVPVSYNRHRWSVGGAQEAIYTGTNKLVLAKRKGLVRVAMRTGYVKAAFSNRAEAIVLNCDVLHVCSPRALLVPCWSFGENELYWQPPHTPAMDRFLLWYKVCSLDKHVGTS